MAKQRAGKTKRATSLKLVKKRSPRRRRKSTAEPKVTMRALVGVFAQEVEKTTGAKVNYDEFLSEAAGINSLLALRMIEKTNHLKPEFRHSFEQLIDRLADLFIDAYVIEEGLSIFDPLISFREKDAARALEHITAIEKLADPTRHGVSDTLVQRLLCQRVERDIERALEYESILGVLSRSGCLRPARGKGALTSSSRVILSEQPCEDEGARPFIEQLRGYRVGHQTTLGKLAQSAQAALLKQHKRLIYKETALRQAIYRGQKKLATMRKREPQKLFDLLNLPDRLLKELTGQDSCNAI